LSSSRYWSYWPRFSTFALIPITTLSSANYPIRNPNLCLMPMPARAESWWTRTLKDSHSCRVVIDSPRRLQRSSKDGGWRYEIVCESVVEITLFLWYDN
jgi:hypothetical protein